MDYLQLRILTPKQVIFEGPIKSLSSVNSQGKFDILYHHANFITLIEKNKIVIKKANDQITQFNFPLAIIYTFENKINIYTDIQLK